jgi:hypothetical protein
VEVSEVGVQENIWCCDRYTGSRTDKIKQRGFVKFIGTQ